MRNAVTDDVYKGDQYEILESNALHQPPSSRLAPTNARLLAINFLGVFVVNLGETM